MAFSPGNAPAIEQLAESAVITCGLRDDASFMQLDGVDPEPFLREDRVNENVSLVSSVPRVREILVDHLRRYAEKNDLVMEGRDIGSVVFPETPFKFYIDASPESVCAVARRRDSAIESPRATRRFVAAASPLIIAEDAHVIDSSNLTIDGVVGEIVGRLKLKGLTIAR